MQRHHDGFVFDDIVLDRSGRRLLDHFRAHLPGRGVTALVGPSGAGKTTLLRLCNRLDVPTAGRVLYRGRDLAQWDPLALRRRVGMVFQRSTPFPGTVRDNLRTAVPHADDARLVQALTWAALDGSWLERDATALSGGQAQRVCIARTLITRPEVLLLDEPTSALDRAATAAFERTVGLLASDGVAVLWVSHDPDQVRRVADRVVEMEAGRCTGHDALDHPMPARRVGP
jgi:putative ABC transport system ATP-binding protein